MLITIKHLGGGNALSNTINPQIIVMSAASVNCKTNKNESRLSCKVGVGVGGGVRKLLKCRLQSKQQELKGAI